MGVGDTDRSYLGTSLLSNDSLQSLTSLSTVGSHFTYPDKSSIPGTVNLQRPVPSRRPLPPNASRSPRLGARHHWGGASRPYLPSTAEKTEPNTPGTEYHNFLLDSHSAAGTVGSYPTVLYKGPQIAQVESPESAIQHREPSLDIGSLFTGDVPSPAYIRAFKKAQRRSRLSTIDLILCAIVIPPLGVFMAVGNQKRMLAISIILTLLGWLPGAFYAMHVVAAPWQAIPRQKTGRGGKMTDKELDEMRTRKPSNIAAVERPKVARDMDVVSIPITVTAPEEPSSPVFAGQVRSSGSIHD